MLLKKTFLAILAVFGIMSTNISEIPQTPVFNAEFLQNSTLEATSTSAGLENVAVASDTPELGGDEYNYSCSCVSFVREKTGYNFPKVNSAKDIVVNRLYPQVDSVVIFKAGGIYGVHGHASWITKVGTSTFEVVEKNLKPCEITKRTIQIDDPKIKGYFNNKF